MAQRNRVHVTGSRDRLPIAGVDGIEVCAILVLHVGLQSRLPLAACSKGPAIAPRGFFSWGAGRLPIFSCRRIRRRQVLRDLPRSVRHFLEQQIFHPLCFRGTKTGASLFDIAHTTRAEIRAPFQRRLRESGEHAELAESRARKKLVVRADRSVHNCGSSSRLAKLKRLLDLSAEVGSLNHRIDRGLQTPQR